MVVYNDNNPYVVEWLRNLCAARLIEPGEVHGADIQDIRPDVVRGTRQFHAFAGIGVWSHALQLAGWPRDRQVWTGSCPCQPFSQAGLRRGVDDERHLWPYWRDLIAECRPPVLFGEQVASVDGRTWLDAVQADLEGMGFAVGATDMCAAGLGAPHVRPRLFFVAVDRVAYTAGARSEGRAGAEEFPAEKAQQPIGQSSAHRVGLAPRLGNADSQGRLDGAEQAGRRIASIAGTGATHGLGNAMLEGSRGHGETVPGAQGESEEQRILTDVTRGFWSGCEWVYCRPEPRFPHGCYRPAQPGTFPLADRVAGRVAVRRATGPAEEVEEHWYNRRGALDAIGNAIVPQVAALFVRAVMDKLEIRV